MSQTLSYYAPEDDVRIRHVFRLLRDSPVPMVKILLGIVVRGTPKFPAKDAEMLFIGYQFSCPRP